MSRDVSEPAAPAPTEFPETEPFDYSSFSCPRCGTTMSVGEYRPCDTCIAQLQATQRGEGSDAEAEAYEAKMNVTPNAVALKE